MFLVPASRLPPVTFGGEAGVGADAASPPSAATASTIVRRSSSAAAGAHQGRHRWPPCLLLRLAIACLLLCLHPPRVSRLPCRSLPLLHRRPPRRRHRRGRPPLQRLVLLPRRDVHRQAPRPHKERQPRLRRMHGRRPVWAYLPLDVATAQRTGLTVCSLVREGTRSMAPTRLGLTNFTVR